MATSWDQLVRTYGPQPALYWPTTEEEPAEELPAWTFSVSYYGSRLVTVFAATRAEAYEAAREAGEDDLSDVDLDVTSVTLLDAPTTQE